MKKKKMNVTRHPDRIVSYFKMEAVPLILVTISGLIYNIGLTAEPFFEGKMVQKLYDIIQGKGVFSEMLQLVFYYISIILLVQCARCVKRFYVRRFANDTSRNMRHILYNHLLFQKKNVLDEESIGSIMTKSVADVDACAEGMRKFTTEIFDTGVVLIAYFVMMFCFDWHLTLLACSFMPVAFIIAEKMKIYVYRYNKKYKKDASKLNDATMDRIANALNYRVTGCENNRDADYEKYLDFYEISAVKANIWENTLPPIYNMISMGGVIFILYFGGQNVLGHGFCKWDIATFTAFLSCFAKMAQKSSKAAKIFNAVQKAQVSWKRIKPLMQECRQEKDIVQIQEGEIKLSISNLSFGYEKNCSLISQLSFEAKEGDIIGVTGPVACGKSTLGRIFLCERPYQGSIKINGKELKEYTDSERNSLISYMGHQPELMSDSIENNISMGEKNSIDDFIRIVCMEDEIKKMPQKGKTEIGALGIKLSGGQQARLALARTLYHRKKIIILDDPFSAVDFQTEMQIMSQMKKKFPDAIFILISHRIRLFSDFTRIIWLGEEKPVIGTHEQLKKQVRDYEHIYKLQRKGGDFDENVE